MTSLFQRSGYIPQIAGVIERPRLLAQLEAALSHKLTLICAPPGYGKTTVTAQFAHRVPCSVAWHAIETRERDLPYLHRHCLDALSTLAPGIEELPQAAGHSPTELAALTADYLREHVSDDCLFVLDDVHHLTGATPAELWLRTLVALLPPHIHLIIVSRTLPDLPLTQMIARREVLAFGQVQLRFEPQEIADLAVHTLGNQLSDGSVERLTAQLEGWPAGTVLALHPLPAELESSMLKGGSGPEALFYTLADLMLQVQPPGLRDFLLLSSIPTQFTPSFCVNVLGVANSAYWLAEAQRRNLFISSVSGGLVYHRLFRNFLQDRMAADSPARFKALHIKVAAWYERQNQLDEAFDHYIEAGKVEQAAAIAARVARAYFAQGRLETLLNWCEHLLAVGAGGWELLMSCARIHTDRGDYTAAEAMLSRAEETPDAAALPALMQEIRLQRAMIRLQQGAYPAAIEGISPLPSMLPERSDLRAQALRITGIARLRLGEADEAVAFLEQAVQLNRHYGDDHALANVLQDLGVAYSRQGRLHDASACLQEVVALRRGLGNADALALALNNLGYYYHRGGSYEQAMATFQEGLSVSARAPNPRTEGYLLASMGDLQRDRSAYNEALRLYHHALELAADTEPVLRCSILTSTATLWRWQGNMEEAVGLAREALALAEGHNMVLEGTLARIALWAALSQQSNDGANAAQGITDATGELRTRGAQYDMLWALAICAQLALRNGDRRQALSHLSEAMQIGEALGSWQPLVAEMVHLPALESLLSADRDERSRALAHDVQALHRAQVRAAHVVQVDNRLVSDVTYSLRIRALHWESIERDGEPVSASAWRSNMARDLLLYLLFNGATTREQISLVFWPESSAQRVRSNFHTTLYRARQAVGENVLTYHNGLYRISPDLDTWCDVFELENLVRQARPLSSRDARTEDLWRRAVELYHGDFLPSLDADWVLLRRENLQDMYLEALVGLGECARARHDLREAITTFKRAIDVDPYREDVHRAIMTCYAESGERRRVLSHMERLQGLLWDEMGVEPSHETITLVHTLLGESNGRGNAASV